METQLIIHINDLQTWLNRENTLRCDYDTAHIFLYMVDTKENWVTTLGEKDHLSTTSFP